MEWSTFLLGVVALYGTIKCYSFFRDYNDVKFVGFAAALFVLFINQLAILTDHFISVYEITIYSPVIIEWGTIVSLAFLLSALATFIRDSKPVFAQFPKLYTALPLLIIFSYFLVKDSYAIKNWLVAIYQGGAIIVSILMYSVYAYRDRRYKFVLGSTFIFLITFILFWYVPLISENYPWLWKVLVAVGIVSIIYGYNYVANYESELSFS